MKKIAIFDQYFSISQKRYQIHSFNRVLMGTPTNGDLHRPYSRVSFRMTLSDLVKYLMTRSIARSFCDSWASCYRRHHQNEL